MDEGGVFLRTFTLDTRMRWSIRGRPSGLLTRGIESGISTYMRHPRIQALVMLPVPLLRRLLGIHPLFETIPSPGSVTFSYRITGQQVTVGVQFDFPARSGMTVCVLNEPERGMVHGRMERGTPGIPSSRLGKGRARPSARLAGGSGARGPVLHGPAFSQSSPAAHRLQGQGTCRGCLLGRFLY